MEQSAELLASLLDETAKNAVHRTRFNSEGLPDLNAESWRRLVERADQDVHVLTTVNQYELYLAPEIEQRLVGSLMQHPCLAHYFAGWNEAGPMRLCRGIDSSSSFGSLSELLSFLSKRLVHKTILSSGQSAIAELFDLLNCGMRAELQGFEITFLVGISEVEITPSIAGEFHWLPYETVRLQMPTFTKYFFDYKAKSWSQHHNGPVSALIRTFCWRPLIASANEDGPSRPYFSHSSETAVELLSCTLRQPLFLVGRTYLPEKSLSSFLGDSGASVAFPWQDRSEIEISISQEKWSQFESLNQFVSAATSKTDRGAKIRLACSRLASTARRSGPRSGPLANIDRIVDLAVALEALVGTGREGVTESLASRTSWLLGTSFEERYSIRVALRKFYRLRSDAVHGRELPDGTSDRILDMMDIVTQVLEKIQRRGAVPTREEWDSIMCGKDIDDLA